MCGIVGYNGFRIANEIIIDILDKLSYRGYDSSGIAILNFVTNKFITYIEKKIGKVSILKKHLSNKKNNSTIGIGHTRWATHGEINEKNCHPHFYKGFSIVHNGIVENFCEILKDLSYNNFFVFPTTDSELIVYLIYYFYFITNNLIDSINLCINKIIGDFSILIMFELFPEVLICVKKNLPLIIGKGKGENFISSDYYSLLEYTNNFIVLEDYDINIIEKEKIFIFSSKEKNKNLIFKNINKLSCNNNKDGYLYFMLKEIYEQSNSLNNTIIEYIKKSNIKINLNKKVIYKNISNFFLFSCGSSYNSSLIFNNFLLKLINVNIIVKFSSEFNCFNYLDSNKKKKIFIGISQSGETADTLKIFKILYYLENNFFSICNTKNSSISRICDFSLGNIYTFAGLEISVASTKSFLSQISIFILLSLFFYKHKVKKYDKFFFLNSLVLLLKLPFYFEKNFFLNKKKIKTISLKYKDVKNILILAKDSLFPIALEGALKIKEISYIHAEACYAGELKHGTIALIDNSFLIIFLISKDDNYNNMISCIREVKLRYNNILIICEDNDFLSISLCKDCIELKYTSYLINPFLYILPLQLFSYYLSFYNNYDVDYPRNLAKSVTVN